MDSIKLSHKKLLLVACILLPGLSIAEAALQDVVTAIQIEQQANTDQLNALSQVIGKSDDNTRGFLKSLYDTKVQADIKLMFQKSPIEDLTISSIIKLNAVESFSNSYKLETEVSLWEKSMLGFSLPYYSNGTLYDDRTVLRPVKDLSTLELKDEDKKSATAEYQLYNKMLHSCSDAAIEQKAIKNCKDRIQGDMTAAQAAYAPYKLSTLLGKDGYAQDSNQAIMAQDLMSTLIIGLPQEGVQQALREGKSPEYIAKALVKESIYSVARYALNTAYVERLQPTIKAEDGKINVQPSEMELITKFTQDSLSEQTLSGIAQSSGEALLRSLYYQMAFNNKMQVKRYKQGERMEALMASILARQGADLKEQNEKDAAVRSIISSPGFMK